MARNKYYVTTRKNEAGWHVVFDGETLESFSTQADAIAYARKCAIANQPSQVLVMGTDGKWRTEWTYGDDPEDIPG